MKIGKPWLWEKPRRKRGSQPPTNKYGRRRARLRAQGRCVRCGKPSAPYEKCDYHRDYARIHHVVRTFANQGIIVRVAPGLYKNVAANAVAKPE